MAWFKKRYRANDGTSPNNIAQTKLKRFRISTIQLARLSDDKLLDQFETLVLPLCGFTAIEHAHTETETEAREIHAYFVQRYRQIDREMDRC